MFNDLKDKRVLITGSTAGMGLAAAKVLAKYGAKIGINIVSPDTIDIAFHDGKSDKLKAAIASSIPIGRFGRIEEVAPTFAFFASHACSGYVTSQILDVNGGQMAP